MRVYNYPTDFTNCDPLKGINENVGVIVEEGVTEIPPCRFSNSDGLVSVTFPSTLRIVHTGAFSNTPLMSIIGGENISEIQGMAFYNTLVREISTPSLCLSIGESAFENCKELVSASFKDVRSIGDYAFSGCENLRDISLESVESIGNYAFKNCAIESLELSPTIKKMGNGAFEGCGCLSSLDLKNARLSTIPYRCFEGCPISTISWSDAIVSLRSKCFHGCELSDDDKMSIISKVGIYENAF